MVFPALEPSDTISTYPYLTCSLSDLESIHSSLTSLIRGLARPSRDNSNDERSPSPSPSDGEDIDMDLNPTFDDDGLRVNIDHMTLIQLDGIKQMLECKFGFESIASRVSNDDTDDSILRPRYITRHPSLCMDIKQDDWKHHMEAFNRLPDPTSNPACDSDCPYFRSPFNFTSLCSPPFLTPPVFHSLLRTYLNIYTSCDPPVTISTSRSWCEHFLLRIASTLPQNHLMSVHSDTPPFTELDSPRIRSSPSVIPIPVRSWEGRELISVSEVMLVKIWDYTVSVVDTLNRGSYLCSQIDGMKSHISNGRIKPSCIKSLFKLFVVPSEMDGLDIEDLTVRLVLELHRWLLALNNSDDHEATQKPKHIRGALTNGSQWIFVILSESPSTTTSPPSTPSPTTYTYKETIKFDPFRSGVRDYPFPSDTPFEEKVDSIAAILRSWIVHCFEDLCDDDLVMVPTPRRRENVGSFGGLKSKT